MRKKGTVSFAQIMTMPSICSNLKFTCTLETFRHANTLPFVCRSTDIHEHQMTPRNTLVISAYNNTPCDLSSVGGPADGWIVGE